LYQIVLTLKISKVFLPSDCLYITSNSVGNLSVLDENHNMIGYIDLCFEQFIELT